MIIARFIDDTELRRLEKLPGAAERRIAGAPASSIAGLRADLRRMRRLFGRPIATAPRDARAPGRRMKLAERSLARLALADLEPAIRAEITNALHEALR